jgi:hypothetical protein
MVRERFTNIRDQYRKSQVQINKWNALPKSGSAAKKGRPPKPYKFAAELAFLEDILKLEQTVDTLDSERENDSCDVSWPTDTPLTVTFIQNTLILWLMKAKTTNNSIQTYTRMSLPGLHTAVIAGVGL